MKKLSIFIASIILLVFSVSGFTEPVLVHFDEAGTGKTGLTATIDIIDVSDGSVDVNDGALTELAASGWYWHDFSGIDATKTYVWYADGSSSLCDAERYKKGAITLTTAKVSDGVWDEATAGHVAVGSTGLALGSLYSTIVVRVAQCGDAGGATTIDLDAGASAVNDFYKGQLIANVLGTGAGQARTCTGYDGATKIATITPAWATNPDGDSYFAVINTGSTVVVDWADGGRLDLILDAILLKATRLRY